jgi:hypothetical protein
MTEPRLTGCVVMGPVGTDLFLAIRDNALPSGSFDGLALAHPHNLKRKVPPQARWSPLRQMVRRRGQMSRMSRCVPSKELFRP